MNEKRIIQVEEKVPVKMLIPLSIQHMFAMFGASVLVPFIFGINPAIVLFMNGLGTFLFIWITKGKAPAYLGSSFAFLAPAGIVISQWGYEYALGGFVVVGFLGCVLAGIIYKFGSDWIDVVLPPAAMGPVVALIGLELAGTAADEETYQNSVLDCYDPQPDFIAVGMDAAYLAADLSSIIEEDNYIEDCTTKHFRPERKKHHGQAMGGI